MIREMLNQRFDDFVSDCEAILEEQTIERIIARRLEPLYARIAALEAQLREPKAFPHSSDCPPGPHLEGTNQLQTRAFRFDPYRVQPGPVLDAVIHRTIMGAEGIAGCCPPYSTEVRAARKVVGELRSKPAVRVTVGRTGLQERPWFARLQRNDAHGFEAFAETLPLAVCRLALTCATPD